MGDEGWGDLLMKDYSERILSREYFLLHQSFFAGVRLIASYPLLIL